MLSCCPICYSVTKRDPSTSENNYGKVKEQQFLKLLHRYFNEGESNIPRDKKGDDLNCTPLPLERLAEIGMISCGDCIQLMESFSKLYFKLKETELLLNLKVDQLKNILKESQSGEGSNWVKCVRECIQNLDVTEGHKNGALGMIDSLENSKNLLIAKCSKKLKGGFPKVLVGKQQKEVDLPSHMDKEVQVCLSSPDDSGAVFLRPPPPPPMRISRRSAKRLASMTIDCVVKRACLEKNAEPKRSTEVSGSLSLEEFSTDSVSAEAPAETMNAIQFGGDNGQEPEVEVEEVDGLELNMDLEVIAAPEETIKCIECGKEFPTRDDELAHRLLHFRRSRRQRKGIHLERERQNPKVMHISCRLCRREFGTVVSFQQHSNAVHTPTKKGKRKSKLQHYGSGVPIELINLTCIGQTCLANLNPDNHQGTAKPPNPESRVGANLPNQISSSPLDMEDEPYSPSNLDLDTSEPVGMDPLVTPPRSSINPDTKQFDCPICSQSFTEERDFQEHFRSVHTDRRPGCPNCNKACENPHSLYKHFRKIHMGKRFECYYCNLTFSRAVELITHKKENACGPGKVQKGE